MRYITVTRVEFQPDKVIKETRVDINMHEGVSYWRTEATIQFGTEEPRIEGFTLINYAFNPRDRVKETPQEIRALLRKAEKEKE